jgi:hypothetical protein
MCHREDLRKKALEEDIVLCLAAGAGKIDTLVFLLVEQHANPNANGLCHMFF